MQQYQFFLAQIEALEKDYNINTLTDGVVTISKKGLAQPKSNKVDLTLSALIHGNEVYGVGVLNQVLTWLRQQSIDLPIHLGLIIGNLKGAQQGKRFLDKDLNRSFGAEKSKTAAYEVERAAKLATLMANTELFLDFHQTIEPSKTPFFIFPYQPRALAFAQALMPTLPVVTHWGKGFSQDGMSSDEFVQSRGGCGITVECGQAGSDPLQIALGAQLALNAIYTAKNARSLTKPKSTSHLFTLAESLPNQHELQPKLLPGLKNFTPVDLGETLGTTSAGDIIAPISGWTLFPKYIQKDTPKDKQPKELVRIIRKVNENELPRED